MSKNLTLCFDGTSNEPRDAQQDHTHFGGIEDGSITNVLKLHLLFGGDLAGGQRFDEQLSLYYPGVGTAGSKARRIFNAAFAPDHLDVGRIIRAAVQDVRSRLEPGDRLFVFGFSRGAAIARRFASVLGTDKFLGAAAPAIRLAGLFDTVASIGVPNLHDDEKPVSDVVFEHGTISPLIDEALHLLALDERRKAFLPTLMNSEDRVTEIWLPGAHADVGGGYRRDGLSDGALELMLAEFERRGLGLQVLAPAQVKYDELAPADADYSIDYDDVMITPDCLGTNHEQKRLRLTTKITLGARDPRVNVDDEPTDLPPIVHEAVAERIQFDSEYRPRALRGKRHKIRYDDLHCAEFDGLRAHLLQGRRLDPLSIDGSREVIVRANLLYNRSGVLLEQGGDYFFEIAPDQEWYDADIACGPDGWDRTGVRLGIREAGIAALEPFRRERRARWFEIMGCVGESDDEVFRMLEHTTPDTAYRARSSGELCSFANDMKRFYGNNSGRLRIRVRRAG